MKRIDLKIGFNCNNNCLFCVQGNKRFKFEQKTLNEIKSKLEKGIMDGAKGVVFTGGEPTEHKELLNGVKYAKSLGYEIIQIQSNGRNFSNLDYCKKLVDFGVNEFGPSIHGFYPQTHDYLVGIEGAYNQVIKGFENLNKLNQKILINTVITKQNYKELPKLAILFSKYKIHQFQFAFVHILGTAAKQKELIVPKKSEIISYVLKGLFLGKKLGMICMTEAIPFCFMTGYEWAIAEYNYMPETKVFDAELTIDSYKQYRQNEGKIKGPPCKNCGKKNICEGPWKEYVQMYGWNEFNPL